MDELIRRLLSMSFLKLIASLVIIEGMIVSMIALFTKKQSFALRLFSILFIVGISIFANHWATYFAAMFIIATAVTELEFLLTLAAIVRGDKEYHKSKRGNIPAQAVQQKIADGRNTMQYKILNTLWTKQVNHFPALNMLWTFRINSNSPEYSSFRENAGRLLQEGLIGETDDGQYYLTTNGWNYCKTNHEEFPVDQWWPDEPINSANLKQVLGS